MTTRTSCDCYKVLAALAGADVLAFMKRGVLSVPWYFPSTLGALLSEAPNFTRQTSSTTSTNFGIVPGRPPQRKRSPHPRCSALNLGTENRLRCPTTRNCICPENSGWLAFKQALGPKSCFANFPTYHVLQKPSYPKYEATLRQSGRKIG